jgi:hypothetical protein
MNLHVQVGIVGEYELLVDDCVVEALAAGISRSLAGRHGRR